MVNVEVVNVELWKGFKFHSEGCGHGAHLPVFRGHGRLRICVVRHRDMRSEERRLLRTARVSEARLKVLRLRPKNSLVEYSQQPVVGLKECSCLAVEVR